MAEPGPLETILAEVGKGLLPLKLAVSSPRQFEALLLKLGWRSNTIPQPLQNLGSGLDALFTELKAVVGAGLSLDGSVSVGSGSASTSVSADTFVRLGQALTRVIDGIDDIVSASNSAFPPALVADDFKGKFPKQLLDYLLIEYLQRYQSGLAFALRALGVVKTKYLSPSGNRPGFVRYRFDLADLPKALTSPAAVLENAFGWGADDFDFGAFATQVDNLLMNLGVDVFVDRMRPDIAAKIDGGPALIGGARRKALRAVIFERSRPTGRMAAEIRLLPLPKKGGQKPGFALMPFFNGVLDTKMQLAPEVAVTLKSDLDLQGGVALMLRPGAGIETVVGFDKPGSPSSAKGSMRVSIERSTPGGAPTVLVGSPGKTRLQASALAGACGVALDPKDTLDVFAEFEAKGLEFVFQPGDADGFIQMFFPDDGAAVAFDLALGVSFVRGLYFRGTSHFQITVPTHIELGPIELQAMSISVGFEDEVIPVGLGVSFKLELGPLKAVVEDIGLTCRFAFPDGGGNAGPVDISFAFKPPKGAGISIDAGVVSGGGYLYFDHDREEYAGVLELSFTGIVSITAIGLLTTRMPDGSKGFSLLIIMSVEFGTPIQLGFGFTLLAVGGLIGVNRTMKLQVLMEGVRTGAIESVMFPKDVVANAPKIISDLKSLFPPQEGTFLIGPMAKLGWGTPTLVSVSLGIIIEIPGNIAILGIMKVALPADDVALLVLQVNFAGAIEFDRKRIYFFAALFESRVLFITIEGEMGLLVAFGDDANFVLSVGGFHPRFSPPPLPFPSPRRIAISLINTSFARVRVEGYFAVTSNSVQFGARVEVFFGFDAINIDGHLAFDALFQFSPFFFIIEISAHFSLNVFGMGLFGVSIRGSLEGPAPWRMAGEGSITILFIEVSADFDVSWGESRDSTLPPITVMPLLKAEFEKAETWRALLPTGQALLVSLRKLPEEEAALVLHPVGVLRVTQRRLPLELTLDTVGNQKPSDVNRLHVAVAAGGLAKKADTLEQFAPAQFTKMSDAEKLSRPAFGPEKGGLDLSSAGQQYASSRMVRRIVRYEEIIIDSNFKRFRRRFFLAGALLFDFFLGGASVARCALSHANKKKMQPFEEKVDVQPDTYTVALQSTNKAFSTEATSFASEASAHEYLRQAIAKDASLAESLHVIPSFERAA